MKYKDVSGLSNCWRDGAGMTMLAPTNLRLGSEVVLQMCLGACQPLLHHHCISKSAKSFLPFWAFPVADKLTSEPKFENLLHRCS